MESSIGLAAPGVGLHAREVRHDFSFTEWRRGRTTTDAIHARRDRGGDGSALVVGNEREVKGGSNGVRPPAPRGQPSSYPSRDGRRLGTALTRCGCGSVTVSL